MNQPCNYTTTGGCPEPQAAQGCAACSRRQPADVSAALPAALPAAVSRAGAVPAVSAPVPASLAG